MNKGLYTLPKRLLYLAITIVSLSSCHSNEKNLTSGETDSFLFDTSVLTTKEEKKIYAAVKDFYDDNFKTSPINGGFLVAKNGKILFEAYRGTLHFDQKDTIRMHTPLHIASTSKTFTAMGILYLAEKELLNITDTLQTFFPDFPYKWITIKDLLTHRSALPNYMNVMDPDQWKRGRHVSNNDVLEFLIHQKPALQGIPGKKFTYCNTNYVLLALIIEKISGKEFGVFLKETFFNPIGMKNTFVCNSEYQKKYAPSYRHDGTKEAITWLDDTYGDKNICSTPRDLLLWDQALYGNKIFSQQTLDAAFTPYSFEKKGINNYGLGWRMYMLDKNTKVIYHNGWWHGTNSCFYRLINEKITIIAIGNKMNKRIYKVKPLIESIRSVRFENADTED